MNFLLKEDGFKLLLESSGSLLLETTSSTGGNSGLASHGAVVS